MIDYNRPNNAFGVSKWKWVVLAEIENQSSNTHIKNKCSWYSGLYFEEFQCINNKFFYESLLKRFLSISKAPPPPIGSTTTSTLQSSFFSEVPSALVEFGCMHKISPIKDFFPFHLNLTFNRCNLNKYIDRLKVQIFPSLTLYHLGKMHCTFWKVFWSLTKSEAISMP